MIYLYLLLFNSIVLTIMGILLQFETNYSDIDALGLGMLFSGISSVGAVSILMVTRKL